MHRVRNASKKHIYSKLLFLRAALFNVSANCNVVKLLAATSVVNTGDLFAWTKAVYMLETPTNYTLLNINVGFILIFAYVIYKSAQNKVITQHTPLVLLCLLSNCVSFAVGLYISSQVDIMVLTPTSGVPIGGSSLIFFLGEIFAVCVAVVIALSVILLVLIWRFLRRHGGGKLKSLRQLIYLTVSFTAVRTVMYALHYSNVGAGTSGAVTLFLNAYYGAFDCFIIALSE
jgi:hypothetical protein